MAKKTKFFTVAGCSRMDGEVKPCTFEEVFKTRKAAGKFIAETINEMLLGYKDLDNGYDIPYEVKPSECTHGYRLSCYNDEDDIIDLSIVEHTWE